MDLGKWLKEEHCIAEPLRPEHFQGYENLPSGEHLDQPDFGEDGPSESRAGQM